MWREIKQIYSLTQKTMNQFKKCKTVTLKNKSFLDGHDFQEKRDF